MSIGEERAGELTHKRGRGMKIGIKPAGELKQGRWEWEEERRRGEEEKSGTYPKCN